MSTPLRVLLSDSNDPYFNLAAEDWIYRDLDPDCRLLFLWRNEPTIVIGRSQNAWSECDVAKVQADGIHLVRRHSGGGAVYQDLGNTCFTFMSGKEQGVRSKELHARNNQILIRALARFGVELEASGRNDLVVCDESGRYKVSGSAFKESPDRLFHHGTMLFKVDLGRLASYLTPSKKKLEAKGIASVRSRVRNLSELCPELDHDAFCQAVIEEFFAYYGSRAEIEALDSRKLAAIPSLRQYREKLASWEWNYAKTPNFRHFLEERFSWGMVEVHLDTDRGRIQKVQVFSDALDHELIADIPVHLQGVLYRSDGILGAATTHRLADPERSEAIDEFYRWLAGEI